MNALPEPIDRFVEAVNRGDTDAFLAFFPADGVVDDWGRRFVGREAIRGWSDGEFIGAKGRMTVTGIERSGNEVGVTADWKSERFTGPSRFVFVIAGDEIREMRITSA
jgi:ketosteroid isomerase-like protein